MSTEKVLAKSHFLVLNTYKGKMVSLCWRILANPTFAKPSPRTHSQSHIAWSSRTLRRTLCYAFLPDLVMRDYQLHPDRGKSSALQTALATSDKDRKSNGLQSKAVRFDAK